MQFNKERALLFYLSFTQVQTISKINSEYINKEKCILAIYL